MNSASRGLRLLAIDTSTELCSAALLLPGGEVVLRETLTERSHADLILPMVDEVFAEAGLKVRDLDGLAFGRGPGGFTGVRIAAGVIQGLAYGAGLKVAPVSSLAAAAFLATSPATGEAGRGVLVCNDARMNELYWACYRFDSDAPCEPILLSPERVGPADSVQPAAGVAHCAGNGIARYPGLRARLVSVGLVFHEAVYPRADAVARIGAAMLARGAGVAPAEAVPAYVRDDVARPSSGPAVT
jgi:tRNA threonylcarbamoyladenosine biosynthesis protein TsaB